MALSLQNAQSGMAMFSTRNGKYVKRQMVPNMSVVIRSDPVEDRDTMAARLLTEFLMACKDITTFNPKVGDYFDGYDQELHGFEFLRAVLIHIARINAVRAQATQEYIGRWMATNTEAFALLNETHRLEQVFTEEDINQYGKEFLNYALLLVKNLRDQANQSGEWLRYKGRCLANASLWLCRGCSRGL